MPRPGVDWVSAGMALVTASALAWAAWLRYGPPDGPKFAPPVGPPVVGKVPPLVALLGLDDRSPVVLPTGGPNPRIVWLTFWSADSADTSRDLKALRKVWDRLKREPRFVMAAAAVDGEWDAEGAATIRAMVESAGVSTLPVYLAPAPTARAFGATLEVLPFHVLIDETGVVGAVVRGCDDAALTRLAEQARQWLDDLKPFGRVRFATNP